MNAAPAVHVYGAATPGRVVLFATQRSWVEVRNNAKILFMRTLDVGESYNVTQSPGVSLWVGNAGGLAIYVDGKQLAPLGRKGELEKNISLDPQALLTGQAAH